MKSGIYRIINLISSKVYIGSAVDIRKRKNVHFHHLRENKHHSQYLQNSYNKHGSDNFVFEIIELISDRNDLIPREQYYLDSLFAQEFIRKENNKFRELTYNLYPTAGSRMGITHSVETKNKIRNKLIGTIDHQGSKNPMFGSSGENNPKNIPIIQYSLDNNIIKEYKSILSASKENNLASSNIVKNCKNKSRTCGGFVWKYKDI